MNIVKISDLSPKQEVESAYLIKYINLVEAKDSKKYLNIILADSSGDIEARVWNNAEEIKSKFEKGQIVQVKGKVNIYQSRKQFVINSILPTESQEVDQAEFVSKSQYNADKMYQELTQIVDSLDDVYIRELLQKLLGDEEITRRLKRWPAGKSIHHAYEAGLLEHILSCSKLAIELSDFYKVNKNYVVCGAIMHDLCKIYELSDDLNTEYTEEGKLVGHLVKGVELLDRFAYKVEGFPYEMKLHLKHILLSHHGDYAYGSPKVPQTSEAMLVHQIDMMDSKMNSFETVKENDSNLGNWSSYIKHLDRIIYKKELPSFSKKKSNKAKKKTNEIDPNLKYKLGNALKDFKV